VVWLEGLEARIFLRDGSGWRGWGLCFRHPGTGPSASSATRPLPSSRRRPGSSD